MEQITAKAICDFKAMLIAEEKSPATVEKYTRDVAVFSAWLGERELSKDAVVEYKEHLRQKYAKNGVNSVLASLNRYFSFCERHDCRVKALKIQRQIFASREKELTKAEYERLLVTARKNGNRKLYFLMQAICSTGIRVSELKFITLDAVLSGRAEIECKGKARTVFIPKALCKTLKEFASDEKITSGAVFVSKNGKPLDRSNIWKMMKSLCESAGVAREKVFPHNLRHLFARTYYSLKRDIARLADILGHSSIETTRIYTMESGDVHRRQIEELGLLLC